MGSRVKARLADRLCEGGWLRYGRDCSAGGAVKAFGAYGAGRSGSPPACRARRPGNRGSHRYATEQSGPIRAPHTGGDAFANVRIKTQGRDRRVVSSAIRSRLIRICQYQGCLEVGSLPALRTISRRPERPAKFCPRQSPGGRCLRGEPRHRQSRTGSTNPVASRFAGPPLLVCPQPQPGGLPPSC
jgi:hypothetical protein